MLPWVIILIGIVIIIINIREVHKENNNFVKNEKPTFNEILKKKKLIIIEIMIRK